MSWSNRSTRDRLSVEKSHSLSLSIRVEDRLHRDMIQALDECWFTVRPDSYVLGMDDLTAEVSVSAVQATTTNGKVFRFDIQASDLNLDPELEWFYDITYSRDGYSLSLISGGFEVGANVTNRGAGDTFAGGDGVYNAIATVDARTLLNFTNSMPTPEKGDAGMGSFLTTDALSEVVGTTVVVPAGTITTYGRAIQDGDILFSTTSKGVLAVITSRTLEGGGLVSVNALVKQVYGLETLKALLDTVVRAEAITTIDHAWAVLKTAAPLPPSYQYHAGDLVFSQAANVGALDKYMVISVVTAVNALDLSVQTKIVFPMFADAAALQDMFDAKVSKTQTVNSVALTGPNTVLSADAIPDGSTKVTMTAAERTKLGGVASGATANSSNATLLNRANHNGEQAQSTVTGLVTALNLRVESTTVDGIWRGTQASYDQIVTKDPRTLYFIEL